MRLQLKLFIDYYVGGLLHILLKIPVVVLGRILGRSHDLSQCSTVTVIKLLGGGSLVVAYPALLAMKESGRIRKLQLLTSPSVRPFGEILGVFDEVILVRDSSLVWLVADSLRAMVRLFRTDVLIDLEINSRLTTVFALLTCARDRIGFYTTSSLWRRNLVTHLLFCNLSNGIYYSYDQLAALFGAAIPEVDDCRRRFRALIAAASPDTSASAPFTVTLAPCCSDLSVERMLRPEEWVEILQKRLPEWQGAYSRVRVHLLGGPADRPSLAALERKIAAALPALDLVNEAGKQSLRGSVGLLAASHITLCIDSAMLHFSRLLGTFTVSYWGASDPRIPMRPSPLFRDEVHYYKLPCSPCVHVSDRVPCGGNNICMRLAANPDAPVDRNPYWLQPPMKIAPAPRPEAGKA